MLKPGQIIVYNDTKGGWFSSLQRFFTRMNFTHSAVVLDFVKDEISVIEAKNVVTITPFVFTEIKNTTEYWVFELENLSGFLANSYIKWLYLNYAGKQYGYLQLLYFLRRYIWETGWVKFLFGWLPVLFGKPRDVRNWNNWFVGGTICSELVWQYLKYASYSDELDKKLSEWNSNNFHAGDVYTVCTSVPGITLVEKRTFENGKLIIRRY